MRELFSKIGEWRAYFILAALMGSIYFYSSFLTSQIRFGFNQFSILGFPISASLMFVVICLLFLIHRRDLPTSAQKPIPFHSMLLPATLSVIILMPIFWFFRNGFINADGLINMRNLLLGIRIVHHDEMLSTLIITKIWESGIMGVRPEESISAFSVFFGGIYIWVIVVLGGRLVGSRWPMFLLLCLSSGFVQMFFGDVEFYAMVAALTALYILAVLEHLRGRISLLIPAIVLTLAIFSHLLAGWLLPSYLFLLLRGLKRKEWRTSLASLLVMILVAGFIFIIITDTGLPLRALTSSHAMGSADKGFFDMLAPPSLTYYASVTNVLFLLFPFWLVIPIMLLYKRIEFTQYNIFLGICTIMLLLLAYVWFLGLGPYFDWNLVATLGIPASILVWGNMLRGPWIKGIKTSVWALLLIGAFHSWTWIAANNHEYSSLPEKHMENLFDMRPSNTHMDFRELTDVK